MSLAVVFDSAGTLLNTYRVAKDIGNNKLLPGIETTTLTFSSPDRVLIVLPVHSKDIIGTQKDQLLSTYLVENNIRFGVSCTRKIITAEAIGDVLYTDTRARVEDLQECIKNVWTMCKAESVLTLNSGAIVNMAQNAIEFAITAGGWPFDGAKETITALHRMGVPTYIASGDRSTKLEKMADHLGIPRDRVYGVATPSVKAQIVTDLKEEY
ncbi:MAG: HAD family hydrolase, partial [Methanoregula sp.]|nr:HAD family hydrolase [Methanoregula sp.]